MLQVGAVLSESGERGLLLLQPVGVELEASESVSDVLARKYSCEQMFVEEIEISFIDANASASRPGQPCHATPPFAHYSDIAAHFFRMQKANNNNNN